MATSHTSRTSRILGPDGQPLQLPDLDEPQTARLAHLQRELQSHPTRGLTPSKLARILDAAETGDMTAQFELFEDMEEKDGHIAAEMGKRRRACVLDWDVVPPEGADAAEKKIAAQLGELLMEVPDFEDMVFDLTDAIGKNARRGITVICLALEDEKQQMVEGSFMKVPLFAGKQVAATGWCSAWNKKAA